MARVLVAVLLVLLLVGCASRDADVELRWVGRDISEAVERNGATSRTVSLLSGDTLYIWEHVVLSGLVLVNCTTRLQVDRQGRIVAASRRYDSIFC